jgi:hypothetical protein
MINEKISMRQIELIRHLQKLDPTKRHRLILELRGVEPWVIIEQTSERKIELKPDFIDNN